MVSINRSQLLHHQQQQSTAASSSGGSATSVIMIGQGGIAIPRNKATSTNNTNSSINSNNNSSSSNNSNLWRNKNRPSPGSGTSGHGGGLGGPVRRRGGAGVRGAGVGSGGNSSRRSGGSGSGSFALPDKETLSAVGLCCFVIVYVAASVLLSSRSDRTDAIKNGNLSRGDNSTGGGGYFWKSSSSSWSGSRWVRNVGGMYDDDRNSRHHPKLGINDETKKENNALFDAIAMDVIKTLDCYELLQKTIDNTTSTVYNPEDLSQEEREHIAEKAERPNPLKRRKRRRRLEQDEESDDDYEYGLTDKIIANGQHLFCVAAFAHDAPETKHWRTSTERIHCLDSIGDYINNDETTDLQQQKILKQRQQSLLTLWSTARSEMTDENLLKTVLSLANEQDKKLLNKSLHVWAPTGDEGTEFLFKVLNNPSNTVDEGGIIGMGHNLGPGKLFVDVGSGLGYTSIAIAILYPGTEIVSIEAASTNWLLQQMNWLCHDFTTSGSSSSSSSGGGMGVTANVTIPSKVILAGIGPSTSNSQMAKFTWHSRDTSSTRAWKQLIQDPAKNVKGDLASSNGLASQKKLVNETKLKVTVKLRAWKSIQSEADIHHRTIDVLNVDCEGCEYNLIPALEEEEFRNMKTIMGAMHWGYIPVTKLPSSARGNLTHARLCQHENFARTAIECCSYLQMHVISSVQDEILVQQQPEDFIAGIFGGGQKQHQFIRRSAPKTATVQDVVGSNLCTNFDQWAIEHNLDTIESDFGWFEVSQ